MTTPTHELLPITVTTPGQYQCLCGPPLGIVGEKWPRYWRCVGDNWVLCVYVRQDKDRHVHLFKADGVEYMPGSYTPDALRDWLQNHSIEPCTESEALALIAPPKAEPETEYWVYNSYDSVVAFYEWRPGTKQMRHHYYDGTSGPLYTNDASWRKFRKVSREEALARVNKPTHEAIHKEFAEAYRAVRSPAYGEQARRNDARWLAARKAVMALP